MCRPQRRQHAKFPMFPAILLTLAAGLATSASAQPGAQDQDIAAHATTPQAPDAPYDPLRPPGTPEGYVLIEGDILIPAEQWYTRSYRPGSAWPEGIIPFAFDPALTGSNQVALLTAMSELIVSGADVEFVYRTNEPDHIYMTISQISGVSYSTGIGRSGGRQSVAINPNSWDSPYTIKHELLHALGFYHEQSRPDRDQNVQIEWSHINTQGAGQFDLESGSDTLNTPYDFTSIMHYGSCSFSNCSSCSSGDEDCRTITTLNPAFQSVIGNRDSMGIWDLVDLQMAYGPGDAYYATSFWILPGNGTLVNPWNSLASAISNAGGNTIWCRGSSVWNNVHLISIPAIIKAHGGSVVLQ